MAAATAAAVQQDITLIVVLAVLVPLVLLLLVVVFRKFNRKDRQDGPMYEIAASGQYPRSRGALCTAGSKPFL